MAGPSSIGSSGESSQDFSTTKITSNGNNGVITSALWLTIAAGLCFPWLLEQPPESRAEDTAKSVAWYVMLTVNIIIAVMSIFSLWFRQSTLSIMLLIWGSCAILGTFLVGSFAMLPAVAVMCCCAPELCVMGAADTSALDDNFCYAPRELCMENKWTLWLFYGGILLAMISIVLLVNSVALHHKTLVGCERQRNEVEKAARAAYRSRRRRQELWEQEVYGGNSTNSAPTIRGGSSPTGILADDNVVSPRTRAARNTESVAPLSPSPPPSPIRTSEPARLPAFAATVIDRSMASRPVPLAPLKSVERGDLEMQGCCSPVSASSPTHDGDLGDARPFSIGAYTGPPRSRTRDLTFDEESRRMKTWGGSGSPNTEVVMSWVADREHGGGRITPKTALRFKTSALARAMHT